MTDPVPDPKEPTIASMHPVVVVGYDGTPAASAAVSRGVERVLMGGHLVVVQAYEVAADPLGARYGTALEDAADTVARSIDQLAADYDADEIIIGTRGGSRVGVDLGSVASRVLDLADRPVTVIPMRMVSPSPRARTLRPRRVQDMMPTVASV